MKVEFAAQSSRDGLNPSANTARLVNCYLEPAMAGGKGAYQIRAVPGMAAFADLGRVWTRAMSVYEGVLHVICGGGLFRIANTGAATLIAEVGNTEEAGLAQNTGKLTIASGGAYYTWDGSALNTPATGAVTDVASVSYLGGYTILTELGGRLVQWSGLADPETFNGLHFASAETTDKPLIRGVVWRDVLLLFKAESIEQWAVTGLAGPDALRRIPGADMDIGLRGYGLVATFPAGLAFASSDGKIMLYAGAMRPISTPPVEVALTESGPQRMFYYERRGHGFICVTFASGPAWCYDIATGVWHERDEHGRPWSASASVKCGHTWLVGTDTGRVAKLTERCMDFGSLMVRRAVSLPLYQSQPFTVAKLELFPRMGADKQGPGETVLDDGAALLADNELHPLGDDGPDGREAQISIRVSRDGVTFGPEKVRSLGVTGRYDLRSVWRNLGQFRQTATFETRLSSVEDIPLMSSAEVVLA